jgi:hypothetical protein
MRLRFDAIGFMCITLLSKMRSKFHLNNRTTTRTSALEDKSNAAVTFTDAKDGLFKGQSEAFFGLLKRLAEEADGA